MRKIKKLALGLALMGFLGSSSLLCAVEMARHPKIRGARNHVDQAITLLNEASHDCGGHRIKAIEDLKVALNELNQAVEYADAHPEESRKK